MNQMYRFLQDGANPVIETMAATTGTIPIGKCRQANLQFLASPTSANYEVALKPVTANTGTCSKASCAAVLTDNGTYECFARGGAYWIAWHLYNGSAEITGVATDRIIVERLG